MRKFLAVLLSAVMVLTLAATCVSAADATVITTAEQFAAMTADGNYKLGADLTISATYTAAFTGTFDGNGKTVTTTVPLFAEFNGTAKDLTIKGSVDTSAEAGFTGAFACLVNGNASFTSIKNEASVKGYLTDVDKTYRAGTGGIVGTVSSGIVTFDKCENSGEIIGHSVGGILGSYDDALKTYSSAICAVTFTGCKNSGHVNASLSTKTTNAGAAGGIIGLANKIGAVTFINCSNSGRVEADAACTGPAGGICAYIYTTLTKDEAATAVFTGCTNSGEVSTGDSQGAGICGWSRLHSEFTDCVNSGYIHSGLNASSVYNGYVAGIACRANADKGATSSIFTNCLNEGTVESGRDQAGGILAYDNAGSLTFINCTNSGKVSYVATPKNNVQCGGIIGNHGNNGDTFASVITCKNCVNSGEITANNNNAGGIISYVYGTSKQYGVIENCVNYGKITGTFASQLFAYTNTVMTTVKNCVGAGSVNAIEGGTKFYGCIFGCSSVGVSTTSSATVCDISGIYLVENDGTEWYSYAEADGNALNRRYLTKEYSAVISSNAITNPAYSTTNPGAVTRISASDVAAKVAALGQIGYVAPQVQDPDPQPTGDSVAYIAAIAMVSVFGMGIALKSRKEN